MHSRTTAVGGPAQSSAVAPSWQTVCCQRFQRFRPMFAGSAKRSGFVRNRARSHRTRARFGLVWARCGQVRLDLVDPGPDTAIVGPVSTGFGLDSAKCWHGSTKSGLLRPRLRLGSIRCGLGSTSFGLGSTRVGFDSTKCGAQFEQLSLDLAKWPGPASDRRILDALHRHVCEGKEMVPLGVILAPTSVGSRPWSSVYVAHRSTRSTTRTSLAMHYFRSFDTISLVRHALCFFVACSAKTSSMDRQATYIPIFMPMTATRAV